MEITEVRVKLVGEREDKLRAFCTVTLDYCFVVRDLKVIRGSKGMFVAMPSRKLTDLCPKCGGKNHLRARFCNDCGYRLAPDRAERDDMGRAKLHADVAHPINQGYREQLQSAVLEAYEEEVSQSERPGYRAYDDDEGPPSDDGPPADAGEDDQAEADAPSSPPEPPPDSPDDSSDRFGEGIFP